MNSNYQPGQLDYELTEWSLDEARDGLECPLY